VACSEYIYDRSDDRDIGDVLIVNIAGYLSSPKILP
jgi:hypothetical protein